LIGNTTDAVDEMLTTGLSAFFTGSSHESGRVSRTMEGGEKPMLDSPISDLLWNIQWHR